ncbi:hypothetical protein D7W79_41405 [Corallococcus exercitus]|nr:hypothetical protein D7W79_41405 [Corallococcus exercitus]
MDEQGRTHAYADPEAALAEQHFAGRPWKDFAHAGLLQWGPAAVSLRRLTPRALAYYLPAYLTALLTAPVDPVAFTVLEAVVGVLTPPVPVRRGGRTPAQTQAMRQEQEKAFADFVACLDARQRSVCARFLHAVEPLLEDDVLPNPASDALGRHWAAHLTP